MTAFAQADYRHPTRPLRCRTAICSAELRICIAARIFQAAVTNSTLQQADSNGSRSIPHSRKQNPEACGEIYIAASRFQMLVVKST